MQPRSLPFVGLFLFVFAVPNLALGAQEPRPKVAQNTSGGVLLPEEACYDVLHYTLDLEVDPSERKIGGKLTMTAEQVAPSPALIFDLADELTITAVRLDGQPVEWTREAEQRVRLPLSRSAAGRKFTLGIEYGGKPRRAPMPPWRGGFTWKETADGRPFIATSCQGEGADLWWPCKDHPSDKPESMDLNISVPEGLFCASNGRLVGQEPVRPGWVRQRWHVSTPISNYAVALNIAPYVELSTELVSVAGGPIPVRFWVLPENEAQGRAFLAQIVEHLSFFERTCGPYPFRADKYGVVETPHLGMEHQTIIAYGNAYSGDPNFDYDWLHHHELAHEWWGNLVTARDWNDFWIHEGIGTYAQALFLEEKFGAEAYFKKMRLDRNGLRNQGAVAPRQPRDTNWMYFGGSDEASPANDIYFKGSWICHTLRWVIGKELFMQVLRRWAYPDPELEKTTDGSACRLTDTDELLAIAEKVSGRELDWFFDVYLRQPALPELVSEVRDDCLFLRWSVPGDLPFPMPVPVQLGAETLRLEVPAEGLHVPLNGQTPVIDPEGWLLKQEASKRRTAR
jgi:aminopeptidase N